MKLSVLLAEDDVDLADTVICFLESNSVLCDHAENGVEAVNLSSANTYDVIVLDVRMPRLNGFSACQTIRNAGNDTPIMMLTARDTLDDKHQGFTAGADDYLVKPFELKELLMRVNALSKRRSKQGKRHSFGSLEINSELKAVTLEGQVLPLTPTGWKIMEILAMRYPSVVSKGDMERYLWGEELPDTNSLKVHLYKLRKHFASVTGHSYVESVAGHGYVLSLPQDNG